MESSIVTVVIVVLITVIMVVMLFLTTFCCIHKYCHKERAQKYRYSPLPQPEEDIELEQHYDSSAHSISYSHSTEPCDTELGQLSSSLSSLSQDDQQLRDHRFCIATEIQDAELGKQTLHIPHVQYSVELGELTDTLPVTNIVQSSMQLTLPQSIKTYIANILIPYFMDQRAGNQFAVVLLLSKTDYQNINKVKLSPSNIDGKPQVDNSQRALPPCTQYCNYIVLVQVYVKQFILSKKSLLSEAVTIPILKVGLMNFGMLIAVNITGYILSIF